MFEVLTVIAPLFIIIFTSAILQKFNALGENWDKVLNEFALKIGLPVLIFSFLANARLDFVAQTQLIVIGLFIGKSKFGKIQDWIPVLLFSICILILIPALFYLTLLISNIDPIQFTSSIIQAAMPLAITPFALADKYTLDKDFIAKSIVLSTILSVFSLPFWIYFLGI
jgi:predicted permease